MKTVNTNTYRIIRLCVVSMAICLFAVSAHAQRAERALQAKNRAARDKAEVKAWARSRGMAVRHDNGKRMVEIRAIRNNRPIFYTTLNEDAAISTAVTPIRNTAPFNLTGSGVTVGIWDGGSVMTNHQEFGARVTSMDGASSHYHATHVGGTIGATGLVTRSEGMAPLSEIHSYDWNSDDFEMTLAAASSSGETGKLYISNHSYGILAGWFIAGPGNPWSGRWAYHWWGDLTTDTADEFFGQYGSGPRGWDQIVSDNPYFLPFKAAGNERNDGPSNGSRVYFTTDNGSTWTNTIYDNAVHALGDGLYKNGYDTIPYLGTAKNIMTIGAVSDAVANGARAISNAATTVFSSWGPADDGRIKPDLVANGDALYSCHNSSTSAYASRSGTSMSSPNACGSAALLVDYYDDLFPGEAMRASTLKGLLIHTADDLGRTGPDYQYGWGLVNAEAAAELLKNYGEGSLIRLVEDAVSSNLTSVSYTCFSDGIEPIRATLCWTDPAGSTVTGHDSRTPVLVNDLDIKITGPGGTYYPYRLNYADPEALATATAENDVDNVEQILIEAPGPGTYTITVDYDGGLQGGEQYFSLITTGVIADLDGDGLPDFWESGFFLNSTGGVANADADGDGFDNLSEYIAGSNPTDPDSVFMITTEYPLASTGNAPFVIEWDSIPGRVYSVSWTYHLLYVPFTEISSDIRWPVNSYTDTVDRVGDQRFYHLHVEMDD